MRIKNLTMTYGLETLYEDVNINVKCNDKECGVGTNGAGKTTLFKIILGLVEPDNGKVIIENNGRIDFLPQIIDDNEKIKNTSVFNYLLSARSIEELNDALQITYNEI